VKRCSRQSGYDGEIAIASKLTPTGARVGVG
jgi:hypothetical protein